MIKKTVYYGIAMLVIAVIVFFGSGYFFTNGVRSNILENNFTIKTDSFSYLPITYSNVSEIGVFVFADKPINVYLLNATDYSKWSSYALTANNPNGLAYVETLGLNSSTIFKNMSIISAPYLVPSNSAINFSNRLYVVMDNTLGSSSSASQVNSTVEYLFIAQSKFLVYELVDSIALILALAGIIIIVYGILKKTAPTAVLDTAGKKELTKDQKDKEYVDKLYRNVKKSKKKHSDDE